MADEAVVHDWRALSELARMPESERRRRLRLHNERGFQQGDPDIAFRNELDRELAEISRLELAVETAGTAEEPLGSLARIQGFSLLASESAAFAQYVNGYLFFSVRFAAGRLPARAASDNPDSPDSPWNQRDFPLPEPPPVDSGVEETVSQLEIFLQQVRAEDDDIVLRFLDDYVTYPGEVSDFELWLRGLLPEPREPGRFEAIARRMYEWALWRFQFHLQLERRPETRERVNSVLEMADRGAAAPGEWQSMNPLSARFGLYDLYYLARILRAEVSERGMVQYRQRSWLAYLSDRPLYGRPAEAWKKELLWIEEVLRAVFDFACDLIQNAIEIAEDEALDNTEGPAGPRQSECEPRWRAIYDRELDEISRQRKLRGHSDDSEPEGGTECVPSVRRYWSSRVRTGRKPENLFGLALSGGGIRSATFSLGVIQGLKELDLLRQVDYLSTVSGGGYIGAWLTGNVRRTQYWLSKLTTWDESVMHLREYSRYLAPRAGFLSADTWVIWGTWFRNALLIQLTAIVSLAVLIAGALCVQGVFTAVANHPDFGLKALVGICLTLAVILGANLIKTRRKRRSEHRAALVLTLLGSFVAAALLFGVTLRRRDYSDLLKTVLAEWGFDVIAALLISLSLIALCSLWPKKGGAREVLKRIPGAVGAGVATFAVLTLTMCGVSYLFGVWAASVPQRYPWYAYVFGSSLVLASVSLAIIVFIGLLGWSSEDWKREWWTRFGARLALYSVVVQALAVAAVLGPEWLGMLFQSDWQKVKWGGVLSWAGSVIAGLVAGNSTKTKGTADGSSKTLQYVAVAGGLLFVVGFVLAVSTVLRILMANIWLSNPKNWYWDLDQLLVNGVLGYDALNPAVASTLVLLAAAFLFSWRFNLNIFGLNQFYRNRLVRCYLGATRWAAGARKPNGFTGFDDDDDINMADLQHAATIDPVNPQHFRGPFHIVNCALNLGGSPDLRVHTRQSASFVLTPLASGCDRRSVGYAPMKQQKGFANSVTLGQAISISGAAASPNMGYNTTPLVAVLLTLFNVRLGWWFPNPSRKTWNRESPRLSLFYMVKEFLGLADETSDFINVSDGGHFENLGVYELLRRRASVIIACDGECDRDLTFGSLGSLIRNCETDFGAKIDLDVSSIRKQAESGHSRAHCAAGRITYSNGSIGYLIYIKASITGDEDAGVAQYHSAHPDFPHQSTGNQFYREDQFEAYRRLGRHIARSTFRGAENERDILHVADKLFDLWAPAGFTTTTFLTHAKTLERIWERLRGSSGPLSDELAGAGLPAGTQVTPTREEQCMCLEVLQLMENLFLDLRLDLFWDHPDNRGWAMLFNRWAKSSRLREVWKQSRHTFGIRFEYFCGERLGMESDRPVVRV
ncbi:MAG: patatin-like phospholipase family protein [Bryobacteraceae bacterium]